MISFNNCPICSSSAIREFKKIKSFTLFKCNDCNIVFLNPKLEPDELSKYYDEHYYSDIAYKENAINLNEYDASINYNLEQFEKRFGKKKSLLEIGAGCGYFLNSAKKYGYNVEGIEISDFGCKFAKDNFNLNLFQGDVTTFSTNKTYDLIYMSHSLEHMDNPLEVLKKAYSMLNNNGVLWTIVPNYKSIERYLQNENWEAWSLPYHLFHFEPKTLKSVITKAGFDIISIERTFYSPSKILKNFISIETNQQYSPSTELNQVKRMKTIKNLIKKPLTLILPGTNLSAYAIKK